MITNGVTKKLHYLVLFSGSWSRNSRCIHNFRNFSKNCLICYTKTVHLTNSKHLNADNWRKKRSPIVIRRFQLSNRKCFFSFHTTSICMWYVHVYLWNFISNILSSSQALNGLFLKRVEYKKFFAVQFSSCTRKETSKRISLVYILAFIYKGHRNCKPQAKSKSEYLPIAGSITSPFKLSAVSFLYDITE